MARIIFSKALALFILSAICLNAFGRNDRSNPELIPFRKGKKWGYCDANRKIIVACKYDSVSEYFYCRRAFVMKGDKFGYIDPTGKEVIPLIYSNGGTFYLNQRDPIATVTLKGKYVVIDTTGKTYQGHLIFTDAIINNADEGPEGAIVITETGYGFATEHYTRDSVTQKPIWQFDTVIKPNYQNIINSHLGGLIVEQNSKWGTINLKNEIVVPLVWDSLITGANPNGNFNGYITVKNRLFGLVDFFGNVLVATKYKYFVIQVGAWGAGRASSTTGLIKVQTQNEKWGYISQLGIEYFED